MKIWKKLSEKKVLLVFISEAHCEYKYQELLENALTAWNHAWSNKINISTIYLEFDIWENLLRSKIKIFLFEIPFL